MSDLHVEQCGMQSANPALQLIQKLQRPSGTNVDRSQLSPIRNINETAAEDDPTLVEEPPPQIRQVRGVARFAAGQSEIGELFVGKRTRGKRHGQLGLRPAGKLREFERFGIRGEQHPAGANETSADVENQRRAGLDAVDRAVLEYKDAELYSSPRQSAHQFARVQRSAGHFLAYSQFAGVGPMNERAGILAGPIEFMNTRKNQVAIDIQTAKDRRYPCQHIAETRHLSGSGAFSGTKSIVQGVCPQREGIEFVINGGLAPFGRFLKMPVRNHGVRPS